MALLGLRYGGLLPALIIILLLLSAAACGGSVGRPTPPLATAPVAVPTATPTPVPTPTPLPPTPTPVPPPTPTPLPEAVFRYVNSGWVTPLGADYFSSPFAEQLRAAVIDGDDQLAAFQRSVFLRLSWGNQQSLARIDFEESVLLAAWYLWRPVKGDPLAVTAVRLDGGRAIVELELDENPQGREYPYLFAPMIMVAVERAQFPNGQPPGGVRVPAERADGHAAVELGIRNWGVGGKPPWWALDRGRQPPTKAPLSQKGRWGGFPSSRITKVCIRR